MLQEYVSKASGKSIAECSNEELYLSLLKMCKEMAQEKESSAGKKKVYYISAEFLIGKLLSNNLINLGVFDEVKKELQILCVWFTEECGGILTMEFDQDGMLEFKHITSEYDGYYDEIGADLKIKQYREEKKDLLEALELYYKLLFLGLDE